MRFGFGCMVNAGQRCQHDPIRAFSDTDLRGTEDLSPTLTLTWVSLLACAEGGPDK